MNREKTALENLSSSPPPRQEHLGIGTAGFPPTTQAIIFTKHVRLVVRISRMCLSKNITFHTKCKKQRRQCQIGQEKKSEKC